MSHRNDLESARERLSRLRGREFWRSLEELSGDPAFQDLLHREFPRHASEWEEGLDRRRFLQLAAASLALAGLSACTRQPLEGIRSEEHTSELQSPCNLVCRLLLEKKKQYSRHSARADQRVRHMVL